MNERAAAALLTSEREDRPWRKFAFRYLSAFIAVLAAVFCFIVFTDPYDSGRFALIAIEGVSDNDPRSASASRGRDPRFDAAIFGNSHGQLLSPARLAPATGRAFVQLTVPGTGPQEQLALMRWFVRHHPQPRAIVIATDMSWCTLDPALPVTHPFPFWLYGHGIAGYLANVLSMPSLERSVRRIAIVLGWRARSDPSGYWDYEAGRTWSFRPDLAQDFAGMRQDAEGSGVSLPGIDRLKLFIASLPETVPVVLVMPPVFVTALPRAGSAEEANAAHCKASLARLVAGRPHSGFIDAFVDGPPTRDPMNFMDHTHYRASLAKIIESDIAAILSGAQPR